MTLARLLTAAPPRTPRRPDPARLRARRPIAALLAVSAFGCTSSGAASPSDAGASGTDATTAPDAGSLADGSAVDGGSSDAATGTDGAVDPSVVSAGARWIGRVDTTNDAGPQFAWSGTGLVATVSGTTISVKLTGASNANPIYFQPVIDGTPGPRFSVPGGEQTVTLASGIDAGAHRVELYRETEGMYGVSVFGGFMDGTSGAPPQFPGRLIEIVGDSISAGYGDLGSEQHPNYGPDPDGGCTYSTATQSAYATYGAIAGRTLGADVSIVALSGWGIYRDNNNDPTRVLPAVYLDSLGTTTSPRWSFAPEPQAVVINLGTNDFAMGDPGATPFEAAYTAFLATIRGKYPDAWIFCAVGPLLYGTGLSSATTYIQAVVAAANANGDAKVQYLVFAEENTSLGTGCDYHPNVTEQQAMADALVPALRTSLGW